MDLGAFSISLAVKDLIVSRDFYQKLGFEVFAGDIEKQYLMLRNGHHVIGLFEGMFENNILTFNPGWNQKGENVASFTDVRSLQDQIKAQGIVPVEEADPEGSGPASLILVDPDGNPILIDQHI